jgi:prepilin-type N-terminal cleavage/methylation domain-containing protein
MKTNHHILHRTVPVDWHSQEWPVAIHQKLTRRFPSAVIETRTSALWRRAFPSLRNPATPMNTRHLYRFTRPQAFTLIEMLVVIAIIAILAGILLPVIGGFKVKAKIKQAHIEMLNLAASIKAYEKEYNRFPGTRGVEGSGTPDFTYGTDGLKMPPPNDYDNRVVMYILQNQMDQAPMPLKDEIKGRNPRNLSLFDAKPAVDGFPGIGTGDHVFRDPWGNPYIITIDVSGDDKCVDLYYKTIGGPGFVLKGADHEFSGDLMIWSLGPDKKFGTGFDKDNILSWKH